jgi:hypothetical protein
VSKILTPFNTNFKLVQDQNEDQDRQMLAHDGTYFVIHQRCPNPMSQTWASQHRRPVESKAWQVYKRFSSGA